jgi:hypothetical protein
MLDMGIGTRPSSNVFGIDVAPASKIEPGKTICVKFDV